MRKVSLFAARIAPIDPAAVLPIASERLRQLEQIGHPAARLRSLTAELLLCHAVRTLRPSGIPVPPVRQTAAQGKPYFPENPAFQFSISHSDDWAVLAVSDVPLGVDLERLGAAKPQVVRRYFHPAEQDFFFSLPEIRQTDAFYALWVLKESAVKALGTGMHLPFHRFAVSLEPLRLDGFPCGTQLALPEFCDPAYRLGLCAFTDEPLEIALQVIPELFP